MTERRVAFCRCTAAELRRLDELAKAQMRNRNNYVATRLAKTMNGSLNAPKVFPDVVEGEDAVALFLRLDEDIKSWLVASAANAGVSVSRYVRGVLFS